MWARWRSPLIFAVIASLIVALTATPALCALMLETTRESTGAALVDLAEVSTTLRRACGVCPPQDRRGSTGRAGSCRGEVALPFLGGHLHAGNFREGHFVMQVSTSITGTSLDEMCSVSASASVRKCSRCLMCKASNSRVGRAELGEDTWGPHRSEFHVELKPDATIDQSVAQEQLRSILQSHPGIQSEVVTLLGDRISESLSGETAQVAIKIFGEDPDTLDPDCRQYDGRARQGLAA